MLAISTYISKSPIGRRKGVRCKAAKVLQTLSLRQNTEHYSHMRATPKGTRALRHVAVRSRNEICKEDSKGCCFADALAQPMLSSRHFSSRVKKEGVVTSAVTNSTERSFLKSRQSLSYSTISHHFTETAGSLSWSQEPSIGPCPDEIIVH
jgi:hypothetical protein